MKTREEDFNITLNVIYEGLCALFSQKKCRAKRKKKKAPRVFNEEDKILLFDPKVKKPEGPKQAWNGPYLRVKQLEDEEYDLQRKDGIQFRAKSNRFKKWKQRKKKTIVAKSTPLDTS